MCDEYTIWLASIPTIDSKTKFSLIDKFGSAKNVYHASSDNNLFMSKKSLFTLNKSRNQQFLEKSVKILNTKNISFVSYFCDEYPPLLREIYDPPYGLFYMGELRTDKCLVAMIGGRKYTDYGRMCARKFSGELSEAGLGIVSGMARGIDSFSHEAAIEKHGYTIAVLGCGVDLCYPPENLSLKRDIINNGCVVSEYPPGTTPQKYFFPERNRIIAGLTYAVIVVEAGERSGTSITVNAALDNGRDVFAVPGSIFSEQSIGTNNLLFEGALPLLSCDDVFRELPRELGFANAVNDDSRKKIFLEKYAQLDNEEKMIYDVITENSVTINELTAKTGMNVQTVSYVLSNLEISGYVLREPGQRFVVKR